MLTEPGYQLGDFKLLTSGLAQEIAGQSRTPAAANSGRFSYSLRGSVDTTCTSEEIAELLDVCLSTGTKMRDTSASTCFCVIQRIRVNCVCRLVWHSRLGPTLIETFQHLTHVQHHTCCTLTTVRLLRQSHR